MQFDDRLSTVLAQWPWPSADRAIGWRQLVELVARMPANFDPRLFERAIEQIRDDAANVDRRVRVATALAIASLPLPAGLVAIFAADELGVAAPILASARLTAAEWEDVAAVASDECRAVIAAMQSEQAPMQSRPPAASSKTAETTHPTASISDVMARIQRLRQNREAKAIADAQDGESRDEHQMFRWECNDFGEIDWVEGVRRGPLIGTSIAHRGADRRVDRSVERAFASRAPFDDGVLELPSDNALGGSWTMSGIPAFDRSGGRFVGYRGIAERRASAGDAGPDGAPPDSAALRELAHELKTPLNAIVGFAEMINADHRRPAGTLYRQRARDIAAQARALSSSVDDLDYFTASPSPPEGMERHCNLAVVIRRIAPRLREIAAGRPIRIDDSANADALAAVDGDAVERLILRVCSIILPPANIDECLRIGIERERDRHLVSITSPQTLASASGERLLGRSSDPRSPEFQLGLVQRLAQAVNAELIVTVNEIRLRFPRA